MTDFKKYKFDLIPSQLDERDYQVEAIYHTPISLPPSFNYLDEMNPPRDQGTQGSCSAMTAAAIKEWQERKELGYEGYISPQFIYNLRGNKPSEGMTPRDTMKILKNVGSLPETIYPYNSRKQITGGLKRKAYNFKIQGYGKINTIFCAKSALIADGPLYIGLPVYNPDNLKFWVQENPRQRMMGGHAVCVVGWTEDSFILRNSWGRSWGIDGHCFYPFDEWGAHWEVWSAIDADSCMNKLNEILELKVKKKKCWFKRIFGIK